MVTYCIWIVRINRLVCSGCHTSAPPNHVSLSAVKHPPCDRQHWVTGSTVLCLVLLSDWFFSWSTYIALDVFCCTRGGAGLFLSSPHNVRGILSCVDLPKHGKVHLYEPLLSVTGTHPEILSYDPLHSYLYSYETVRCHSLCFCQDLLNMQKPLDCLLHRCGINSCRKTMAAVESTL